MNAPLSLMVQRQVDRWYALKDIPEQLALASAVSRGVRFPVVPAGRRSGKTERAKRFIAKQAMKHSNEKYFAGAPTYQQAKKIWWDDLKALTLSNTHMRRPSESELIIYLPNGTEIHIIGMDKPSRFEGVNWTGGVFDEVDDMKDGALELNIMPALNTVDPRRPDYRAWCWFIGVPEGLRILYEMAQYAETSQSNEYELFTWHSSRILPPDVIEAAKQRMSLKQFRQEYEASFETASGRIYEDYGEDNYTTEVIKPNEQLMWHHDFNFTPMSSAIGVRRGNDFYILDEIVLQSAVARQSAIEFVEKYKSHKNRNVIIYGDPAGRAGEKHGHASDYTEMEQVLRANNWIVERRVKNAAPAIKDRQNAVRAKIKNAAGQVSLHVNVQKAVYVHKGLSTVQIKKGSTFIEEESEFQHITTAVGYCVDYEWPITNKKDVKVEPVATVHHFNKKG